MSRISVLALLPVVLLTSLGSTTLAQSTEDIEELEAKLRDGDHNIRRDAAWDLGVMGPKATSAVPALVRALSDEVPIVRSMAAFALGRVGPSAGSAIPNLAAALSDENDEVRSSAAHALGSIGPEAVPTLTAALSHENAGVREDAAVNLASIGPKAAPAIPSLIAALSDENTENPAWVTGPLGRIGSSLKAEDTLLWWVLPRAYWKELVGLLAFLLAWFAFMARFPRYRPATKAKRLALMAVAAVVPATLACSAVYYAITREWAQGFLPDAVTVVPFPVAAVLSVALVCVLPAVWVCQRKTLATTAVETTDASLPTPPARL